MRRLWFLLVVAAILVLVIAPLNSVSTWPVLGALGVLAYIGADAYLAPPAEGWPLVHAFRERPNSFLLRKITLGTQGYLRLAVAPIVVLLAVNPTVERAATGALAALAGTAVVAGAVLTKYIVFRSGERVASLVVIVSMGVWLITLAMAPPLTLLLGIVLWRGAAKTVAPYLLSANTSSEKSG